MSAASTPRNRSQEGSASDREAARDTRQVTSTAAETDSSPAPEEVIALAAWRPGFAMRAALRHDLATVNLPLVGPVTLPGLPHLAWYGGVAALVVLEIVEPPVAAVMVVAKALVDSRHHELLRSLGEAVESGV